MLDSHSAQTQAKGPQDQDPGVAGTVEVLREWEVWSLSWGSSTQGTEIQNSRLEDLYTLLRSTEVLKGSRCRVKAWGRVDEGLRGEH